MEREERELQHRSEMLFSEKERRRNSMPGLTVAPRRLSAPATAMTAPAPGNDRLRAFSSSSPPPISSPSLDTAASRAAPMAPATASAPTSAPASAPATPATPATSEVKGKVEKAEMDVRREQWLQVPRFHPAAAAAVAAGASERMLVETLLVSLRRFRGTALKAWRCDFDKHGVGWVSQAEFARACRFFGWSQGRSCSGHSGEMTNAQRQEHTDLEIAVGPEDASCTLAAHQSVLAARSPVLAAMFRHRFQEGETAKVRLVDVDFQCFKAYLHLLYTGELEEGMDLDQVLEVLILADRFQSSGFGEVLAGRLRDLVSWDETVGKVMKHYVRLPEDSEYSGSLVSVMGDQLSLLSFREALRQTHRAVLRPIEEDTSRLKAIAARGLIFSMLAFPIMRDIADEAVNKNIVCLLSRITDTFSSLCELPDEPSAKRRKVTE
ncbi:spopla [Symbiodinium natans]|uniref:Spopla protein n=1 Tax=Symbiodinium natans TaxID=878477 RepID=A0A812RTR4_9DINO|nr:spopla [Symbiodinium natans]